MCGIWAVLGTSIDASVAKHQLSKLGARGPEGARITEGSNFQLGFTRLAINGLHEDGMQPMQSKGCSWVCNGEIYNWSKLSKTHSIQLSSGSDCEILGPLFQILGSQTDAPTFFRALDGVFSMVLVDTSSSVAFIARDPYGVRPLYVGYVLGSPDSFDETRAGIFDASGVKQPISRIVFSSELKALNLMECALVESFPPGHYAAYDLKTLNRIGFEAYHTVPFLKNPLLDNKPSIHKDSFFAKRALYYSLKDAVQKRMMTERPVAALLSGGLDSSLIAALVQQELLKAGSKSLQTFSIGFKGSEDLRCARLVADHIGSNHTEIVMTPEQFFEAIPEVIQAIESYDITTVRASVGNYLVSKEIRARTDCKVVFNGDGSDEIFGGYMYFYNAPSDEAFEAECGRLLTDIHMFDVLRSDRSISSNGLEARTPFLDKQFVSVARSISTSLLRPIKNVQCEKWILREAFRDLNILPEEILWRKKEAFSDGVSTSGAGAKSWYMICQEKALEEVGPEWKSKAQLFKHLTPQTPEAYYYRVLFDRFYRNAQTTAVPYHWMPKWSPGATDPSARTLSVYNSSTTVS
jgi:asparagine synthase (glutamine-hydrolysing)